MVCGCDSNFSTYGTSEQLQRENKIWISIQNVTELQLASSALSERMCHHTLCQCLLLQPILSEVGFFVSTD